MSAHRSWNPPKGVRAGSAHLLPPPRLDDVLAIGDGLNLGRKPRRPIEPERRSPVIRDQDNVRGDPDDVELGVEVARVIDEAIGPPGRLPRLPHADEVRL